MRLDRFTLLCRPSHAGRWPITAESRFIDNLPPRSANRALVRPLRRAMMIKAILITLALSTLGAAASYAGYNAEYRKTCNIFVKYRLRALLTYKRGSSRKIYLCPGGCVQKGCTYAAINETWIDNQNPPYPTLASIQKRIGTSPYCSTYTMNSYYSAGDAFTMSSLPIGPDSLGIARSSLDALVDITSMTDNTTINLSSFSGVLAAKQSSSFGSAFRCVIWNSSSPTDTTIRPETVLDEGSVRIENGQVITTGFFHGSDFLTTTAVDSSGYVVLRVDPVPGLTKSIRVSGDDANNTIALSIFGEVGYGTYNPNFIYGDPETAFVPTLSQWGMGALAVLLVLTGSAFVYDRRNNKLHA